MTKARIDLSEQDCELMYKALYWLSDESVSWQEWDARSNLLGRLATAAERIRKRDY